MTIKNLFKKKQTQDFLSFDKFQAQEDFRELLIFQQKARRQNVKNMSF
jgi:hypothetical protein